MSTPTSEHLGALATPTPTPSIETGWVEIYELHRAALEKLGPLVIFHHPDGRQAPCPLECVRQFEVSREDSPRT
jgi:hypothetical protein